MIPYTEFIQESMLYFEHLFPDAKIQVIPIYKNNDQLYDNLSIFEHGQTAAPSLYLNRFYEIYQDTADLKATLQIMENFYRMHLNDLPIENVVFSTFEEVKERLGCRLLSVRKNRHLLEPLPFLPFLDLALVFYYLIPTPDSSSATVLITKEQLSGWGIDQKVLVDTALQYAPSNYPPLLLSLPEMMCELMNPFQPMDEIQQAEENEMPLYILTNQEKLYGASAMLYPQVLSNFSRQISGDLYIIPSSIHEVLLLPASAVEGQQDLDRLVQEVNQEHLAPQDVLSDHVYYYSQKKNRILMRPD